MRILIVLSQLVSSAKKIDRLKAVYLCLCFTLVASSFVVSEIIKNNRHIGSVLSATAQSEGSDTIGADLTPRFVLQTDGTLTNSQPETSQGKLQADNGTVEAKLSGPTQDSVPVPTVQSDPSQGSDKFIVEVPKENSFVPGKYHLEINFATNDKKVKESFTQDFTWGVLAINSNKDNYLPDEQANLAMGVLDDSGNMVCDAKLKLEIRKPDGKVDVLSTDANSISVSSECSKKGPTDLPDYYAKYKLSAGEGDYGLRLTAETSNGERELVDKVVVSTDREFQITRTAPTRIYPKDEYKVTISAKANLDHTGPVREFVPKSFDISSTGDGVVTEEDSQKVISWDADFQKGDEKDFSYTFKAPDISPEFYLLGPAQIGPIVDANGKPTESDHIYTESRQWQIASDATSINISGTCKQYDRSTNCADAEVVKVAINGVLSGTTGSTSTGAWSINSISVNAGDILTVFVSGVADANEANTVVKVAASPVSIAGILLYERHLVVGGASNQTLTNANLSQYDNSVSANEDIFFEVDASSNLLVPQTGTSANTDQVLYIVGGNTFQPVSAGGKTITVPNVIVAASGVLTCDSNTFKITAGTTVTFTGTFNANTSTFNYDAQTATANITPATYYNLGVGADGDNASSTTFSLTGDTTVSNAVTVGAATSLSGDVLAIVSYNLNLNGAGTPLVLTNLKGTMTYTTGSVNYNGQSATSVAVTTYYNLALGNTSDSSASVTYTLLGATTVANTITIGNAGSTNIDYLSGGSQTLTLSASSATAWNITAKGGFTCATSTVNYLGTSATTVKALTYYKLGVGTTSDTAAAVTYTLGGNISVGSVLTIGNISSTNSDILDGSSYTIDFTGTGTVFTITTKGTFTASTSNVTYNGNGATTVAIATYYNLGVGTTSDANGAVTYTAGGAITVTNVFTVGNAGSTNTDLFAGSSYVLTLNGAGTPFNITSKGGFTYGTSSVYYQASGAVNITGGITYYILGAGAAVDTTAAGNYTMAADVTIASSLKIGSATSTNTDTFDASSRTINFTGTGTPLAIYTKGTFTATTSTINYNGNGATTVTGTTYYNMGVGTTSDANAGVTYTAGAAMTVSNVMTVGNAGSTNSDAFAGSSYIITLSGSGTPLVVTSKGSLTQGTSTFNYIGSSATNVAGGTGVTYYNLGVGTTSDAGTGVTYTLNGNITVTYLITIGNASSTNNDTLDLSNKTVILTRATTAPITVTTKGVFTASTSTVKYQGDSAMAVNALTYYNLNFDPPSITAARAYTLAGAITVNNNLTINATSSGTAYALTITFGGAITVTGTTSIAGTTLGTTVFDTKAANNYAFTTGVFTSAAGGTFNGNNSVVTVNGNFTNAGTFNVLNATTTIAGYFTNSGIYSQAATTALTKASDASATITSGSANFKNLTINAGGSTYTLQDDLDVYGDLTLTAGTLDAGANKNINIAGSWTNNGGAFTARNGTVSYVDYQSGKTITSNAQSFYNLTINGTNPTFTSSLLHAEGANNGTTFTDENSANTWNASGAAVTSTTQKKLGSSSYYGNAGATDYISSSNNLSNFQLTSEDFTIDTWVYLNTAVGTQGVIAGEGNGAASWSTTNGHNWVLYMSNTGYIYFQYNLAGNAGSILSSSALTTTTWTHIAVVKTGGYIKLYMGGVEKASTTAATLTLPSGGTPVMRIGSDGAADTPWKGYIDEFRMTKGVGLWNAAFTPPTAIYSSDETLSGATAVTNNLTVTKGQLTVGANNLDVNNMAQTGGTFVASAANTFTISGNYANSGGTFTDSGGTLTLDGSAAQALTAGGTGANNDFKNLTVTNGSANGVTFNDSVTTSGTFTDVTQSSKVTFHSGATYAFNAISLNGQGTGTRVTLTSSSNGAPWLLNITAASPTASNVSVQDSTANKDIDATSGGYDATGNTHWLFPSSAQIITISGNVYTNDLSNSTPIGANKTIALSLNGGAIVTNETDVNGHYSFSNVTINNNDVIALFISGETEKGSVIAKTGAIAGDISISFNAGFVKPSFVLTQVADITNASLTTAAALGNSDLMFTANAGTITYDSSMTVLINKTYRPAGNVVAAGINIVSGGTFSPEANTVTMNGSGTPFTNAGTFNQASSTVLFTGSSPTNIAGSTYYNLQVNHNGTTFAIAGSTTVNNVLTISSGTLDGSSQSIYLAGTTGTPFVNSDTFTPSTSTVYYTGNNSGGDTNITSTTYNNLYLNNGSEVFDAAGAIGVNGVLTVNAGTFAPGANTITLAGTGTPLVLTGTLAQGTSTIIYAGSSATNITASTYYNLQTNHTGTTFTVAGSTTVQSVLTITAGNLDGASQTIILSASGTPFVNNGTFTATNSTVRYTGTGTVNLMAGPYYNLETNTTAAATPYANSTGQVSYWKMDETAGTSMADSSGNSHTASASGATANSSGYYSYGRYFNGSSQYIASDNSLASSPSAETTMLWIKPETKGNILAECDNSSCSNYHYAKLEINADGTLLGKVWDAQQTSVSFGKVTFGQWYHIAMTYDGTAVKSYLNGHYIASTNESRQPPSTMYYDYGRTDGTCYGSMDSCSTYYKGTMDDVRYYSRTLSDSEILNIANSTQGATFNIGSDLTVANNLTHTAGAFAPGANNVSISGSLALAGGYFQAPTSAKTFSLTSNFTNSGGIFDNNSGTLTLNGQGLQTITSGSGTFNNLTITNASSGGVSFADNATISGTLTDVTASSKIIFHSTSSYAVNAININGQATGTRVALTSSTGGSAWNLNITTSSPSASNVSVKDSNANKDIDATVGGYDATGNTHWLFPVFITVSGTVYTAEDKSANIGANKTVALSINGAAATTVETSSGGTFSFSNQQVPNNAPVLVYLSGETEKGALVDQIVSGATNITSLELYTGHISLTYTGSGPITNSILATADNVNDTDSLISVDGSNNATFTTGNQLWILTGKTYTPGGTISANDVNVDGTLTLGSNAATVHGNWDSGTGYFSTSGTVTFDGASGTKTLNSGGIGVSEGWTVTNATDTSYNGTYTQSGTYGGQPSYTNGSKWLFYDYADMPGQYYWYFGPTTSNIYDPYMDSYYYSNSATLPGTFYTGQNGTGTAPTVVAMPSYGGTFTNLTKSGGGTLQLTGSKISITGTLTTAANNTFDLNGQKLTLATLSNNGTLKLQGGETAAITTMDTDSGTVEYSGSGTYSSLSLGNSYYDLKINGSGTWTLGADATVADILNIAAGTLSPGNYTVNLSGAGTPLAVAGALSSSGTVSYNASSATNVTGTTYANLKLNHSGTTFTAAGNTIVSGVLTIQAGNFDAADKTITLSGTGTPLVNSDTFTASTSTVKYTGQGSVTVPNVTYYNLEINNDDSQVGLPYTLTSGLIGYWKFDEASGGTTADSSSSNNTGTFGGSPPVVPGKYSNSRNFTADSDLMTVTSIPLNGVNYSISTWFKYPLASGSGGWRTLTRGSGGDHQVIVRSDNQLGMYDNVGGTAFNDSGYNMGSLSSGWHHLVAVGSGTTTVMYIDGSSVGTSNHKSSADIYAIGNYQGGTQPFGVLDDFRIYNRALTQTEITNLYTGTVAGTYTPAGNLTVSNNLTMAKGIFTAGSNDMTVGNFIESNGTFNAPALSNAFNVNGAWNHSGGVFNHNSATVTFAGDSLVQGDTTFNNFTASTAGKTLSFASGSTQTVAGTWTVNGSPSNHIILQRSGASGQWNINPTGASINGVTVSNSNNTSASSISPTNSTNGGGNTNWDFGSGSASISGTVYTAENGSTNIGANKTIALSINGAAATTTETASDGSYNFANLSIGSSNTIAVYVSGETEKGSLITQASNGSSISGLDIYTGHIVLAHQTAGPMTNTLLATVDNVNDSDLLVSVSGSAATFTAGNKIWIKAGKTYTPGGSVSAGSLEILSTANFTPEANTITLSDSGTPFIVSGTFNQGSSTIIYTGSTATNIAGSTYNNLKVNQTGTTFTAAGSVTVNGVFTIQAGIFDASSQTIILAGAGTPFVKTGTFTASTSTFKYTGAGDTNIVSTTYDNLETSASAEPAGGSTFIVSGAGDTNYNGTYTQSGTYGSNNKPAYTNGSRWIFNDLADMPMQDEWCMFSSKQDLYEAYMQCDYYSTTTDLPGTWYVGGYTWPQPTPAPSITLNPAGYNYTFGSGSMNILGDYTNGNGTYGVKTTADTNDPTVNIDGDFSNYSSATFTASNSADFSIASHIYDYGKFVSSSGTLTLDGQGSQSVMSASLSSFNNINITNTSSFVAETGDTKINGTLTIPNSGSYKVNGHGLTLGTLANNGTISLQGAETITISTMDTDSGLVEYLGSGTYTSLKMGNAYYDLQFSGSGNFTLGADLSANSIVEAAGTLNASSRTITLSGSATPLTLSGSFNEGTSTVVYTGSTPVYVASTTYKNLTLNHSDTSFAANGDILVKGVMTIQAGNLDASDKTITLSSAGTPLVVNGGFTASTSTVKFTGVGNVTIPAVTYNNLETSPTANGIGGWNVASAGDTGYNGTYQQSGTYGSSNLPAYTNGTDWIFNDYADGPMANYWCMASSKMDIWAPWQCNYYASDTNLPGTWYQGDMATAPAPTVTQGDQPSAYTFASGAININGNFVNGDGTHTANINADTNDPTLNVDGNFTNSANATFVASASASFSIASNYSNSGVFTDSGGTLTLDGQGLQTITAGGTNSDHDFNNLTITNASAVSFADSATVAATFTDTAASSQVTFHSTSTYAFNAISIDGGSTLSRIILTSSTQGSPWNLNITASSPSASNVSVRDSSANKDIDATNGGNDLTGNTHWLFPVSSSVTVDSLTFTNPYSSNVAVADDTTAWNFQVKLTTTGVVTEPYVELRFANSSDSVQPYDSLKFKYTKIALNGAFSKLADTQNSAANASNGSDASNDGTNWTYNFKVRFNSNFDLSSTNYAAEVYANAGSSASDTKNFANIYQVQNLSLSASVDNASIAFGQLLPGSVLTGTTNINVTTNYPNGYSISASDSVSGSDSALLNTDGTTRIADYSGTIASPTSWASGTGFGICLYSASGKDTSKWGSGSGETDSNNKYAGVPETATMIHQKTGSPTNSDLSKVGYKLVVPNTQKTGDYSGTVTYTITGALN